MKEVPGANKKKMEMGPMGQGSVEAPGEPEAGLVWIISAPCGVDAGCIIPFNTDTQEGY